MTASGSVTETDDGPSGALSGRRVIPTSLALIAAAVAAGLFIWFATFLPAISAGGTARFSAAWAPSMGVSFTLYLDGLSLIFALLISGIGATIFLYCIGYMGDHPDFHRLILSLFAFMLAMLGLVLAADLISLFVFWELTALTSYLLIGFGHETEKARRNALQALLVTGAGGLALLAGLVLIGIASGSQDLTRILAGEGLQGHALYPAILVLVLLGAFTKSAQFPFHFWLPGAMAAPTPVSAWLHSATMVKAGVYLMARLHPVLSGTAGWEISLTAAGLTTAVLGGYLALRQSDLKQSLAYTTLMALGTITLMLAGEGGAALSAAMVFLIAHALYKAALFMLVGNIDHATGTRDVARLSGLARFMPLTALAALLAGASMAGLPPLTGWIAKELLYIAGLETSSLVTGGALLANALVFGVAGMVAIKPFIGAAPAVTRTPHEASPLMLIGPLLLGLTGLGFGLFPGLLQDMLAVTVAGSLQGGAALKLHLWPGFGLPLALSAATFALGGLFLALRLRHMKAIRGEAGPFDRGWDHLIEGFKSFAAGLTQMIQTGRLGFYMFATVLSLVMVLGLVLITRRPVISLSLEAPWSLWLIALIVALGAALALRTGSRILNIVGLGTSGLGVALIFILFGAPDVALTQLMVETLSAVLFAAALLRLPQLTERRPRRRQILHGLLAGAFGLIMTLIVLAITSHPLDRRLTDWFEVNSVPAAHGHNIVNVILVDFRAFDTFGELTVVLLAAIGAYALLRRPVGKGAKS
ncbi:hydrogen gas-evolving membrane-bound hydrogenase subunit E [Pseudogemmobacter faecipullorum]|uniref:hydrogen gas-evolving membrane-bound hydrogenase subunit E n=1 Tax=Pseudogemmobacter faecipullorum TaxID=2755041 RepID=UPI001D013B92